MFGTHSSLCDVTKRHCSKDGMTDGDLWILHWIVELPQVVQCLAGHLEAVISLNQRASRHLCGWDRLLGALGSVGGEVQSGWVSLSLTLPVYFAAAHLRLDGSFYDPPNKKPDLLLLIPWQRQQSHHFQQLNPVTTTPPSRVEPQAAPPFLMLALLLPLTKWLEEVVALCLTWCCIHPTSGSCRHRCSITSHISPHPPTRTPSPLINYRLTLPSKLSPWSNFSLHRHR